VDGKCKIPLFFSRGAEFPQKRSDLNLAGNKKKQHNGGEGKEKHKKRARPKERSGEGKCPPGLERKKSQSREPKHVKVGETSRKRSAMQGVRSSKVSLWEEENQAGAASVPGYFRTRKRLSGCKDVTSRGKKRGAVPSGDTSEISWRCNRGRGPKWGRNFLHTRTA